VRVYELLVDTAVTLRKRKLVSCSLIDR